MLTAQGKHELIHETALSYDVMIETGLYLGAGSGYGAAERYVVIDVSEENCARAREQYAGAEVWQGDSALVLPLVLRLVDEPACFWLDAHLVVEYDSEEMVREHPIPLLGELEAIRAWEHGPASTILIDDERLFGSFGWPSRGDVLALCDLWDVDDAEDILRLTPKL